MNGKDFLRIAQEAFAPFLGELGFSMAQPSISGRCYCVDFNSNRHQVSVSYEPGDDALFVMVGKIKNGSLANIDNRLETPRLVDLNSRYMKMVTNEERIENEAAFEGIVVKDREERLLLQAAKELRLVIPRYLRSLENGESSGAS